MQKGEATPPDNVTASSAARLVQQKEPKLPNSPYKGQFWKLTFPLLKGSRSKPLLYQDMTSMLSKI